MSILMLFGFCIIFFCVMRLNFLTAMSAKNAKIRINSNTFYAKKWVVDFDADELDVSSFEEGGWTDTRGGLQTAKVSIDFDYDGNPLVAGSNMFDAPLNILPGAVVTNVKLYVNGVTGPFWLFTTMLVVAAPMECDVKSTVKGTMRLKNRGSVTIPTGTMGTNPTIGGTPGNYGN